MEWIWLHNGVNGAGIGEKMLKLSAGICSYKFEVKPTIRYLICLRKSMQVIGRILISRANPRETGLSGASG